MLPISESGYVRAVAGRALGPRAVAEDEVVLDGVGVEEIYAGSGPGDYLDGTIQSHGSTRKV